MTGRFVRGGIEPTDKLFGCATKTAPDFRGHRQIRNLFCRAHNKRLDPLADYLNPESAGRGRGVASEGVRRHNLSVVLDRLHLNGQMSRSQLARQTGLNRSTVRDLLGELSALGLIVETQTSAAVGPGRPSTMAAVRPAGAVVLAVELEVDSMSVATVGLGGHIFDKVRVAYPPEPRSPEDTVSQLGRLSTPLMRALPQKHHIAGVGVAVAGVLRRRDGFIHVSPNLGWTNVPLEGMVSSLLGFDHVSMANEADLAALAEYRRGRAGQGSNLIFVTGEVGVGTGIIHNGEPMLGVAGYAGEAGHMVVNPAGRECRCGGVGCWETEVGEEALARRAGIAPGDAREGLIDEVMRRAHAGDPRIFEAFNEVGTWLGVGIGNLINIFNPEVVVIGGFFHELYPFLESATTRSAQKVALTAPWLTCSIQRSRLGSDAVLMGAAELVFADLVSRPTSLGESTDQSHHYQPH